MQKSIQDREREYSDIKELLNKSTDNKLSEFKELSELLHKVFSSKDDFKQLESGLNQVYLKQHNDNP